MLQLSFMPSSGFVSTATTNDAHGYCDASRQNRQKTMCFFRRHRSSNKACEHVVFYGSLRCFCDLQHSGYYYKCTIKTQFTAGAFSHSHNMQLHCHTCSGKITRWATDHQVLLSLQYCGTAQTESYVRDKIIMWKSFCNFCEIEVGSYFVDIINFLKL